MLRSILPFIGVGAIIFAFYSDDQRADGFATIAAPGVGTIPLALDRTALSDLAKLTPSPGTFFRTSNLSRVKVIERRPGCALVEVLDGEQAGRRGWVFSEWLLPK